MNTQTFPDTARAVVIGGGVIGCSVAYHLTKLGWRDVVLLEQGRLTCGTTWHAAGLVGQLRAHQNMTRLVQYSAQLYQKLEAETGQATGWKQCGSILVARTPERVTLFKRIASAARGAGRRLRTHLDRGGRAEISRDAHRRSARRAVAAGRRQGQSRRRDAGARQGRPHGWRAHLRADARHGDPSEGWRRDRRLDHARRHQGRGRHQLRRPMGQAGRAHVRRDGAAAFGRAHVHRHRPDRRRASGSAGAARSRRLHLREGRGRRAC